MSNHKQKIYSQSVKGFFQRLRNVAIFVCLLIYFVLPWLDWRSHQAILFDIPNRKFYLFNITIWPQDLILLVALVLAIIFALFFITTLAGRIWCGYACPQTVWTKLFLSIEHFVEGDRLKRASLDQGPTTWEKIRKRAIKHVLWILLSFVTAIAFVGYFVPVKTLLPAIVALNINGWEMFFLFLFTAGTYLNAGWMRETICIFLCPYARLQASMFDPDTLIISYDTKRGEPRGHRPRHLEKPSELGDCIACQQCVHVCPTGIDIREGLQIECIACAACVDVCDQVMRKMQYPTGLIRYTTEHALEKKKTHFIRTRLLANAAIFLLMSGIFIFLVISRVPMRADILRDDRVVLYHKSISGKIINSYTLKLINMSQNSQTYNINISSIPGLQYQGKSKVTVPADQIQELPMQLLISPDKMTRSSFAVHFTISAVNNPKVKRVVVTRFLGPPINRKEGSGD